MMMLVILFFFFFSSSRRHTRSLCDWSSDVCSSDLVTLGRLGAQEQHGHGPGGAGQDREQDLVQQIGDGAAASGRPADWATAGWPASPELLPDVSCLQEGNCRGARPVCTESRAEPKGRAPG